MNVGAGLDVERRCAGVGSEEWPAVMGKVEHPHHKYTAFVSSPQRKSLLFLLFLFSTLKCPPRFAAQPRAFRRSSPVFSTGVVPLLNSGDKRARKSREEKLKSGLVSPKSPQVLALSPRLFRNRSSALDYAPDLPLQMPKNENEPGISSSPNSANDENGRRLAAKSKIFSEPKWEFQQNCATIRCKNFVFFGTLKRIVTVLQLLIEQNPSFVISHKINIHSSQLKHNHEAPTKTPHAASTLSAPCRLLAVLLHRLRCRL